MSSYGRIRQVMAAKNDEKEQPQLNFRNQGIIGKTHHTHIQTCVLDNYENKIIQDPRTLKIVLLEKNCLLL